MSFFKVNETVNVLYVGLWQTATILAIDKDKFSIKLSDNNGADLILRSCITPYFLNV